MDVVIEADGGSRGNPGVAGSGTVVKCGSKVLRRIAYAVGKATNNVAEYHGLRVGLEAARELGASKVHVRMDSKLVVEQMSGRWKIKHPEMRELALQCQQIAQSFASIRYEWVPRKENSYADELANKAMDALKKGAKPGIVSMWKAEDEGQDTGSSPAQWNGATMQATRFILLRHGQTEMSVKKQYCGLLDPPLTTLGQRQAEAAGTRLGKRGRIDRIISSPLIRAHDTAAAAGRALGLEVETDDALLELDFGQWDGLDFAQAHAMDPELHSQWLQSSAVTPPGGQSLKSLHKRVKDAREQWMRDYVGQTILLVSHVSPIKSMVRQALGSNADSVHSMHLDLASLSIVEFYADGPSCLRLFNDTNHLVGI